MNKFNKKEAVKRFKDFYNHISHREEIIKEQEEEINQLKETIKQITKQQRKIIVKPKTNFNTFKFAIIGDTQFGSAYEQVDKLNAFYQICDRYKINTVLDTGDVLDGWKVYKGQEFELHARGWDEQISWFTENAPKFKNIQTKFITGNHDASFKKLVGIIPGEEMERHRPDWNFIGPDIGDVIFELKNGYKYIVRLMHPSGGTAYALSYHPQKIIEKMTYNEKPDLIAIGHYHKAEFIPNYCNISCIQSGCFQSQTPFMSTKGLHAMIGGWILEITIDQINKDLYLKRIQTEFITF